MVTFQQAARQPAELASPCISPAALGTLAERTCSRHLHERASLLGKEMAIGERAAERQGRRVQACAARRPDRQSKSPFTVQRALGRRIPRRRGERCFAADKRYAIARDIPAMMCAHEGTVCVHPGLPPTHRADCRSGRVEYAALPSRHTLLRWNLLWSVVRIAQNR